MEGELQGTKEREEAARNALQEEQQKKEVFIQATIEAENVHFQGEKKRADDAEAAVTKAEEAKGKLEEENSELKKQVEAAEEWSSKLEQDCSFSFEDRVYSFLYSTWLEHLEMDYSFFGSKYVDQVVEWNVEPSTHEEGLRARANEDVTLPEKDATPPQDP